MLDQQWMLDLLRDSADVLPHTWIVAEDSTVAMITASPQQLQRFVAEHEDGFFQNLWLYRLSPGRPPVYETGSGRFPAGGVTPTVAAAWGCTYDRVITSGRRLVARLQAIQPMRDRNRPSVVNDQRQLVRDRAAPNGATPCDVLAVYGTPVFVDSTISAGTLDAVVWTYHDHESDATGWLRFQHDQRGWRLVESSWEPRYLP